MKRLVVGLVAIAMMAGILGALIGARVLSAPSQATYQPGWANVAYSGESGPIQEKLASLAQGSAIIYHLDNSTGGWNKFVPARPDLSDLTTATKGEAYLALLTQPVSIDLPSCPAATPAAQCPTPSPTADCQEWQSLLADCTNTLGECTDSLNDMTTLLNTCSAARSDCQSALTDVCSLVSWAVFYYDLYGSSSSLLLDFAIADLDDWWYDNCL